MRWTERGYSANLRASLAKYRHGSMAVRKKQVLHPALHGEHSQSYYSLRPIKREELPAVPRDKLREVDAVGVCRDQTVKAGTH